MRRTEVWTLIALVLLALIFGFSSSRAQFGSPLTQAVKVGQEVDVNTTPITATYTIKPGTTITGIDGVQILSPDKWDPADRVSAEINISRVDPSMLEVPLPERYNNLVTPIYKVETVGDYIDTHSKSFIIRIPIPSLNPDYIMPIRTIAALVESESGDVGGGGKSWSAAPEVYTRGLYIEFRVSTIDSAMYSAYGSIEPYRRDSGAITH
jgi:hypothetical protein